jgi:ElaB/YqjD/DUF883 family membrane-anchored ribosome-binding protein
MLTTVQTPSNDVASDLRASLALLSGAARSANGQSSAAASEDAPLADVFKQTETFLHSDEAPRTPSLAARAAIPALLQGVASHARSTDDASLCKAVAMQCAQHPAVALAVLLASDMTDVASLQAYGADPATAARLSQQLSTADQTQLFFGGDPIAEKLEPQHQLSTPMRVTAGLLVGVMAAVGLTGCGKTTPPVSGTSTTSTQPQTEADKKLSDAFTNAEKAIEAAKSGDSKKAAEEVTKNLLSEIQEYAKTTGKSAQSVADTVKEYCVQHPAVAITILLAAGVTTGVVLEKYGVPSAIAGSVGSIMSSVTDGTSNGLSAIKDQIKQHPVLATAIGIAVAGTVGYLIYQAVTPGQGEITEIDTPAKQDLAKALTELDQEVADAKGTNVQQDAERINKKFTEKVADYAKASGRSAKQVAQDVKGFMIDHPGISAAVILASGVTAGVLLEQAGVPDKIAAVAGSVLDSAKDGASGGLSGIAQTVKDHPVLSTTIIVALAAGASYVIYQAATR